jgi:hypothetical protein
MIYEAALRTVAIPVALPKGPAPGQDPKLDRPGIIPSPARSEYVLTQSRNMYTYGWDGATQRIAPGGSAARDGGGRERSQPALGTFSLCYASVWQTIESVRGSVRMPRPFIALWGQAA